MEDNQAAIVAARNGYSPKFRHLHRQKRISLGFLGEVFSDPNNKLSYADTKTHKGDLMTKEFERTRFEECKKLVGLSGPAVAGDTFAPGDGYALQSLLLPAAVAKEYLCKGGKIITLSELVGAAATKKAAEDLANTLVAGVNSWVIDTGSGHNLVPKSDLLPNEQASLRDADEPLRLATANGIVEVKQVTDATVTDLGCTLTARVFKATPRVLSVQKLVEEHDAKFNWDRTGATLQMHGKMHHLPVKQGVPLLALPSVSEVGRVDPTQTHADSKGFAPGDWLQKN
jgi:hypothetical protein